MIALFVLPALIIQERLNTNYFEMIEDEKSDKKHSDNLNGPEYISRISELETRSGYPQQDGGSDDRLFQYRSMWLDGYDIVNISEVKKVVEFARENNFNCLSPLINGNYYGVYYNSSIFAKHRDVHWSFDPLMELIKEAHKYGIQVHPWYHTLYNRQILRYHPEWGSVYISGSRSSYWMNPSDPQMRDYLLNATMELIRNYPLDGIKLDTIRYGSYYYSYDDYSINKFNESGMTDFSEFRRLQVTEVVDLLYTSIMKVRPYMWVGADVWQSYSSWYDFLFQESRRWAKMGIIDYLTTMSYTTSRSYFETNIKDYLENSYGIPIVAGPYVYVPGNTYHGSVPNETVGIDLMLNQTNRAIDLGVLGVCMFKYTFLYDHPNYVKALKNGPFQQTALCPFKKQNHSVSSTKWEFNTDHDRRGWRVTDMGHYYPFENVWSISDIRKPALMSPLINISEGEVNVIEISMKSESTEGEVKIYWSKNNTVFNDQNMTSFSITPTGEWNLYSIHLDDSIYWTGKVRYIRIVPIFQESTNITIDFIRLQWMPRCIQSWSYLGPFINGKDEDILDREFIMGEGLIYPRVGDVVSGRIWSTFSMERDLVDYRFVYGHLEYAVTYAHVYVRSDREMDLDLRIGSSDGIKVWINGEITSYNSLPRRVVPDQNISRVHFNEGINSVMVKLANYRNEFSYYIRLTDKENRSLDGLEYLQDLPMPSPPLITIPYNNWTSARDIVVSWRTQEGEVDPIFYEWKLDDQTRVRTENNGTILTNLGDGIHIFSIRSIDEIGTVSKFSNITIYTDRALPVISSPISPVNISVTGSIKWSWDLVYEPISSVIGYYVTVYRWYPSGSYLDSPIDGSFVEKRSFEINEYVLDGYRYSIKVTVVSGSGIAYSVESKWSVLSDISPPTKPGTISLNHIPKEPMTYLLEWSASYQHFNRSVNRYEIFRHDEYNNWALYEETADTKFKVMRRTGESLIFKVRGVDDADQRGVFSEHITNINIDPTPIVTYSDQYIEGGIFSLSADNSYDLDGYIVRYEWSLNGMRISPISNKNITLDIGRYTMELRVTDDLGSSNLIGFDLVLGQSTYIILNGSVTNWLVNSSRNIYHLPAENITIYNNITIKPSYDQNEIRKDEIKGTFFTILYITISTIGLLSFLLILTIIAASEIRSYRDDREEMEMIDGSRKEQMRENISKGRKDLISTLNFQQMGFGSNKSSYSGRWQQVQPVNKKQVDMVRERNSGSNAPSLDLHVGYPGNINVGSSSISIISPTDKKMNLHRGWSKREEEIEDWDVIEFMNDPDEPTDKNEEEGY